MKLDLFNSRFDGKPSAQVFDSLEGKEINKPERDAAKSITRASFASKTPQSSRPKKYFSPGVFDRAKINNNGFYVNIADNLSPKKYVKELKVPKEVKELEKLLSTKFYAPTFDALKEGVHNVDLNTIEKRIKGRKLPGAAWPLAAKFPPLPESFVGPGAYDIYRDDLNMYGKIPDKVTQKFGQAPSGREPPKELPIDSSPIQERIRMQRIQDYENDKKSRWSRSASSYDPSVTSATFSTLEEEGNSFHFGKEPRFDSTFYKQEPFVKTNGMLLSVDYDKKWDKRIPFSFETHHSESPKGETEASLKRRGLTAGGQVDVDAGSYFSIEKSVERNPIRYAAAFRSNAPVGMKIPVPTSGTKIGPCSFPGAFEPALKIKKPHQKSSFFLTGRDPYIKHLAPDPLDELSSFGDIHTNGPILPNKGVNGRNVHMEKKVKRTLSKIYPNLARKKFFNESNSTIETDSSSEFLARRKSSVTSNEKIK